MHFSRKKSENFCNKLFYFPHKSINKPNWSKLFCFYLNFFLYKLLINHPQNFEKSKHLATSSNNKTKNSV